MFEGAYLTLEEGIAGTSSDETFFVYTDETKYWVKGYVRAGNGAAELLYSDNEKVIYPSRNSFLDTSYNSLRVVSFDKLRATTPKVLGQKIELLSHSEGSNLGGGIFIARKGSVSDDGGYIAKVSDSWYWERLSSTGEVNGVDFGLVDGMVADEVIKNTINHAITNGKSIVRFPGLGKKGYTVVGGLTFQNTNANLIIYGPGSSTRGYENKSSGVFYHTGDTHFLKFEQGVPIQMFNAVRIIGFTVIGSSLVDTASCFYFADSWHYEMVDCFITKYTNGTGVIVENERTWTENYTAVSVHIRGCRRGWWFRRSTRDGNYSSFYSTVMSNCFFSHSATGTSSDAVTVGGSGTTATPLNTEVYLYAALIDIGGWTSVGGDNSIFVIADRSAITESEITLRYDGLMTSPIGTVTQPIRAFRQSGTGYVDAKVINLAMQREAIDISALIASGGTVNAYPFSPLIEKRASVTAVRDFPSTNDVFKLYGAKIKLKGKIVTGIDSIIRFSRLPLYSTFRITIGTNAAVRYSGSWILSTKGPTTAGSLIREDAQPTLATTVTTNSTLNTTTNAITSTSTATTKATMVTGGSLIYPQLGGALADFTASVTYWSMFELVLNGSAISTNPVDFFISIEMIA